LQYILQIVLQRTLWATAAEAPFYRLLGIKALVAGTVHLKGVCSSWAKAVRAIAFSYPGTRHGILIHTTLNEFVECRRVFYGLRGYVVEMGHPSNISSLEAMNIALARGFAPGQPVLDGVVAVSWSNSLKDPPSSRYYNSDLFNYDVCKAECSRSAIPFLIDNDASDGMQPGGAARAGPDTVQIAADPSSRRVNPRIVDFLTDRIVSYAQYHALLVISALSYFNGVVYLEIPDFVITSLHSLMTHGTLDVESLPPHVQNWVHEDVRLRSGPYPWKTASYVQLLGYEMPMSRLFLPASQLPNGFEEEEGEDWNFFLCRDIERALCGRIERVVAQLAEGAVREYFRPLRGFSSRSRETMDVYLNPFPVDGVFGYELCTGLEVAHIVYSPHLTSRQNCKKRISAAHDLQAPDSS
jgi:hypothetical protein